MVKVVQWGTGTAGLRGLRCVLKNPALQLVGLYVARPERAGRDAGSFVDMPDTGVTAINDVDTLLEMGAECLIYIGSFDKGGFHDIVPFLERGINVVTPTIPTLLTPQYAPRDHYEIVDAACRKGNSSFLSTGASPGFCTDYLPMAILGIVDEIRCIRIQEIADYSAYPVEAVARHWGFGNHPDETIPLFEGKLILDSWESVPRDIARRLGVEIEEIRVVTESGVANKLIDAAFYPIEAGQVANIRFEVQGLVGGEPFVILEHINCCDFDAMPDGWPRGDARSDLLYRVEVEGRPNLTTEVALDYPIAAVRTVNAIPAVVAAKAGILSGADVPPLNSGNVVLRGH
jgi:hypothetical protein